MDDFLNEIRWLGMLDRVRVTSFGERTILDVRAAEPGLATAIIEEKTTYRSAEAVLSYGSTYVVAPLVGHQGASRVLAVGGDRGPPLDGELRQGLDADGV